MADSESIGSVSVSITGDAGPLNASFAAAQASASAAGAKVASAFNDGAQATDQMATAAVRAAAAEAGFEAVATKTSTALRTQVTDIQAVSGTLRTLDGNQGIRAAERFLTMIPGLAPALQSIFPIVGAIAFAEVIARAAEHFSKLTAGANDAGNAVQRAFREINLGAQESNDSLQVANDRLENEIAKIQKKPENGIKLALDEAILSADQLGKSLDSDLSKLAKVIGEQKTGLAAQIFGQASTSDIETEVKAFQDRVAKVSASSRIPRQESFGGVSIFSDAVLNQQKTAEQTRVNAELTSLYTAEIHKLQVELKTAYGAGSQGAVDNTRRVEVLTAAIANLKEQARSVDLKAANANLQGDKVTAQSAAEAARAREEANRKAEESARRQEELYELSRRVWAETQAEIAREQDELNKAAQKLYDTNKKAAEEAVHVSQVLARAGVDLANKSSESLSGVRQETQRKQESDLPANQQALQRLQSGNAVQQQLALAIQLKQVGIETGNEIQSRIGTLQEELAAAERLNVPIETRLKLEKEILDAKIAAAAANGQTDQADKLAAANVALQQTLTQWRSLDLGNAAQDIEQSVARLPEEISSSLVNSLFDAPKRGQTKGQEILGGLKATGIEAGKQLATKLLTDGIEKLIATIVPQSIFTTAQTTATAANTAAAAANTTAVSLNTAAMLVLSRNVAFSAGRSISIPQTQGGPSAVVIPASPTQSAPTVGIGAASIQSQSDPNAPRPLINRTGGSVDGIPSLGDKIQKQTSVIQQGDQKAQQDAATRQGQSATQITLASAQVGLSTAQLAIATTQMIHDLACGCGSAAGALGEMVTSSITFAAAGTDSHPGGLSIVGEKGPELMNVPRGAQIIPNHKIKGYADGTPGYARSYGGSSHSTSIGELHVHAHGVSNPDSFAKAAVAAIPHELKRQTSKMSPYSS